MKGKKIEFVCPNCGNSITATFAGTVHLIGLNCSECDCALKREE